MVTDSSDPKEIVRLGDLMSQDALLANLASINRKESAFSNTMRALQEQAFSPDFSKRFDRRWRISQAADMVGRSVQSIRRKEALGDLPEPQKDANGRRNGYTLQEINHMRDVFETRPGRKGSEEPVVLSFSTFKGGAGKSTLSVHFAQHAALKGYRVLVVDVDPQGSMSTIFGANRDLNRAFVEAGLVSEDSIPLYGLEHFLSGDTEDFSECVMESYFPGIDICPAGLDLFNVEYSMGREFWSDHSVLTYIDEGVRQVYGDYDIVVFDPPPALGFLSLSVLAAANALVIPMRPSVYDFASTKTFLTMLRAQVTNLIQMGFPVHYYFETLAINHMDENKGAHLDISGAMRGAFSLDDFFPSMMLDSAEIDSASKEMKTFFDLSKPIGSHRVHARCKRSLSGLCEDIEKSVERVWETHSEFVRDQSSLLGAADGQ